MGGSRVCRKGVPFVGSGTHPSARRWPGSGLGPVNEAQLIFTCGLPGAGKTELAKRLAAVRGAVRLTKDEWLWALGSTPWDERPKRIERELWRLAREILCLDVSVVLDFGLRARIERDEMRSAARDLGVGVELHYLDVARRTLATHRGTQHGAALGRPPDPHADLEGWLRVFQPPDAAELALFDLPPNSR